MSTEPTADDVMVQDEPERRRYVALVDGTVAGFAAYRLHGDRIVFTPTETADGFEGRGVGSALAAGALDRARSRGLDVVPLCSFIAGYIERHPAYADLVSS